MSQEIRGGKEQENPDFTPMLSENSGIRGDCKVIAAQEPAIEKARENSVSDPLSSFYRKEFESGSRSTLDNKVNIEKAQNFYPFKTRTWIFIGILLFCFYMALAYPIADKVGYWTSALPAAFYLAGFHLAYLVLWRRLKYIQNITD